MSVTVGGVGVCYSWWTVGGVGVCYSWWSWCLLQLVELVSVTVGGVGVCYSWWSWCLLQLVELVFRVAPEQGPAVFTSMLPNIFKSIVEDQVREGFIAFC